MIRLLLLAAIIAPLASCLRSTEFRCDTSSQCGAGNTCEANRYCSFPDETCQRYTDSAGSLAGQCVGSEPPADAGIDAPVTQDASIDAPSTGCPAGYEALPEVPGDHKYRLLPGADDWSGQRDACAATSSSAYLVIPDDQTELAALRTLADVDFWVGVSDTATEGTWINLKNLPQTFLPWTGGAPQNGDNDDDCVLTLGGNGLFDDERCSRRYRAICECEP